MENRRYSKLYDDIFQEDTLERLSISSRWLYATLCRLNNTVGNNSGSFYRSDAQLVNDSKMSIGSVKKAKRELVKAGLIKIASTKKNGVATIYKI